MLRTSPSSPRSSIARIARITRIAEGGHATLFSKTTQSGGVATFECFASDSGGCHYRLWAEECDPAASPADAGSCRQQALDAFALGEHVLVRDNAFAVLPAFHAWGGKTVLFELVLAQRERYAVKRGIRDVRVAEPVIDGHRHIDLLLLRPSVDLGRLANEYEPELPRPFRFLARGLGTRETRSNDMLSLVMFQGNYVRRLLEIGEADATARLDEIRRFLTETGEAAKRRL